MNNKENETVVHHSENDYCKTVKHLKLSGDNRLIGYRLGQISKDSYNMVRPIPEDKLKNQCQKDYIKTNYPIHFERMQGFAEAYGENLEDTLFDFTCFGHPLKALGCSAVYYPSSLTDSQSGILSRNLDFGLGSLEAIITGQESTGNAAVLSNPLILEIHPNKGYSTLGVLCFDLFGLLLDGINSEGLIVTHLHADSMDENGYAPTIEYGVGINEMLVVQMLLDNCKDVDEAKMWLWKNKHFYMFVPTHLLIADKYGKSLVWEYSVEHNKEYVTEKKDESVILTNFPLFKYQNSKDFPVSTNMSCPFYRYTILSENIRKTKHPVSEKDLIKINSNVFMMDKEVIPTRTIYHNIYNSREKSMKISFYRGEKEHVQSRTKYYKFELS